MKEELYNKEIDEFVDWITGENSWTGQNVTEGLKVSGGSIRRLILKKLQKPFYMYEDIENNLYRMFSSENAYQLWAENPSDNSELELFNFVRPSDYKLNLTINSANRFVRYGDNTNLSTRIQYTWDIRNDEGESSESLVATYTISNESTGKSTTFTRWYNKGEAVDFSIYEYLEPGVNTVVIEGKGSTSGARNSSTFNIVLLQLNVSSSFDFCGKHEPNGRLQIPCTFTRNNQDGTARVRFVIDSGGEGKEWSVNVLKNSGTTINAGQNVTPTLDAGIHTLQIWAEAQYNDGSVTILSNLLYYTFIVATSEISVRKYICISTSFDSGSFPMSSLSLQAMQYMPSTLSWGYYTDAEQTDTQISVQWRLYEGPEDQNPDVLGTMLANTREQSKDLQYVPTVYSIYDELSIPNTYVSAYYGNTELIRIPIQIVQNTDLKMYETVPYTVKMSAYGRTNDSSDRNVWKDVSGNVDTSFNNISWDPNSGWYENSFRTVGQNEYAIINYSPFTNFDFVNGKTIEFEFETEKIASDTDKLIVIGNPTRARIEVTPVRASLYNNANIEIVHTNYKANERIKLAFIINNIPEQSQDRTVESGLAYIINNGILERAAYAGGSAFATAGNIQIGGSNSGVRLYNLRIYDYNISYTDAYNNYVYDSADKVTIVNDNNILDVAGEISYDLSKNKLDTILISGDLHNILSGQTDKEKSTTDVTIERICPSDATKNFKINNALIRKHGQSTLNYPITSMKFWLNKSKSGVQPVYEIAPQDRIQFNKNRYRMKDSSIPSNKFVLQANYADSSGVHNGSLQRLIQQSWYNAIIDGEYKLRTLPQLFASSQTVTHKDELLYDVSDVVDGPNEENKLWVDYSPNTLFPYNVRVAPDSLPCVVFYYDEAGTQTRTFLGQYVLMDDKKSDFLYGERSIYKIPSDPFCLTAVHAKDDTKANRVWDNGDVLHIEVLEANNKYSSYTTTDDFTTIKDIIDTTTGLVVGRQYGWESAFEMIYPDPEDIAKDDAKEGIDKFNPNSKFVRKAKPFVDWYTWLVGTKNNQLKFQQEAAQHLDLYKLAAYYIFVLRFGLVDSLERNAQIKTYDGVHFHYEPWDMDIALGNKNDGGIAYDPPIDRNTKLPGSVTTYAISGRAADEQGHITISNWLFDALEAWPYWMNIIVPKVADALYAAGLTYNNVAKMFDENYADSWCETIYNKSGFFKYIESGNGDPTWLSWLQGARMSHRHWWLSRSMDFYDAKWFCGDYKNHYVYLRANVTEGTNANIIAIPNQTTYMTVTKETERVYTKEVSKSDPLIYNIGLQGSSTKVRTYIYGANFMEELDLSDIATGLDGVELDGAYSEVLGSPLKQINIGTKLTQDGAGYTTTVATLGATGLIQANAKTLANLQGLNVQGQRNFTDSRSIIFDSDLTELLNVYAMGSGLGNFHSSESGNKFVTLQLPSTINVFEMHNSTWENLSFWDCVIDQNNNATLTEHATSYSGGISNVPSAIETVRLMGTSCQNKNSIEFVRNWLRSIVANEGQAALSNYIFEADKIYWTPSSVGGDNYLLTYDELALIAQLNREGRTLKGYIVLKNEDNTELTPQQLTQIKEWFGDTVFTKNSSGLIIDHELDYVQINMGGDIHMVDDEAYVYEGGRVSLNATKFSLAEGDDTEYIWAVTITDPTIASIVGNALSVINPEDSQDGIAYLQTSESQYGGNYDVLIQCSALGQVYSTTLHVIGVTYPTDLHIAADPKSMSLPRRQDDYTTLWQNGVSCELYAESDQNYTATIKSITYTISGTGVSDVYYVTSPKFDNFASWMDTRLSLSVGNTGVVVGCPAGVPQDDTIYTYPIQVSVRFNSNKVVTITHNVLIMDDSRSIVFSIQVPLYNAINNRWIEQYGHAIGKNLIYRTDLLVLNGTVTFESTQQNPLTNLVTASTNTTLLKYLPNVTGLVFDNCNLLTSTYVQIQTDGGKLLVFDKMPNLEMLSMQNCSSLTLDLDLSTTNITNLDLSGTTISALLPVQTRIASLILGQPTAVNLEDPTTITPANVTVTDSTNIDSLDITNIPGNKSFTMFAKIMNIS